MKPVVTVSGLLVLGALTLAPADVPEARRAAPEKLQQQRLVALGGEAENLRRVLYIELRQALKPGDDGSAHVSSRCRRSPVGHVEATYLPGYGLCVTVEMKPSRRPVESDEGDPHTKLWDDTDKQREAGLGLPESWIMARSSGCAACEAQRARYSISRVADTLIQTLARHGHRLEQLEPDDRLSVAVHLTGWSGEILSQMTHSSPRSRFQGPGRNALNGPRRGEDDPELQAAPVAAAPLAVPKEVRDLPASGYAVKHLVLTFKKADLLRYQDGELGLRELTDLADVIHY